MRVAVTFPGDVRKSPVGQIPKIWSRLSGWMRFPSSLGLVSTPLNRRNTPAVRSEGTESAATRTVRAIALLTNARPRRRRATSSAGPISGASQTEPPTLNSPIAAALATASGSRLLALTRSAESSGTSTATTGRTEAAASSLIPPQSE